ncbi:IS3 family transposase [Salipaludibacillus sp. CUR1]|uniref:IS3 family transposase n=1 Tax=Salipaludibacillus sp. CUR1 TaxID=2820003 RepID=UPI001E2B98C4|nr:IS3 family transposase [Salipaludibacillus sp. CUR1]
MKALNLARSNYYYHQPGEKMTTLNRRGRPVPGYSLTTNGQAIPDAQIEEYLMELHVDDYYGAMGYRKWTLYLKEHYYLVINKKKVFRLCKKLSILKERRLKKTKHPRHLAKNRTVTGPNQLWQVDIKYGSIQDSKRFFFLCSAIDVYDRCIVGYTLGPTCQTKHIRNMLIKAFIRRKIHFKEGELEKKLIIRTDNGPQFISESFGDFCDHHKVFHERIPKKSPNMNAYIESYHSVIQRECFNRHVFEFYEEAYFYIEGFIDHYNNSRYHGSINDYPPMKYYLLSLKGKLPSREVRL